MGLIQSNPPKGGEVPVFISHAIAAFLVSVVAVNRSPTATDREHVAARPGVRVAPPRAQAGRRIKGAVGPAA